MFLRMLFGADDIGRERYKHRRLERYKRCYQWLAGHSVGVMRWLYLTPVVGVISMNDYVLWAILLSDCAISITYQVGHAAKWDKERL
ncbi:MAG: hypothetical protein IJB67_01845 [Firmicutes bacterium]|nr:hypothetical protein [Bacillota bacterium]